MAKFNPVKHQKVIDKTLADIRAGVFDDLTALENQIAELVASGVPVTTIRPTLVAAFENAQRNIEISSQEVKNISTDTLDQSSLPVDVADDTASQLLAEQTGKTISAPVRQGIETVMETIVIGTAAGVAVDQLARQVRGRISGVFMQSQDPVVRRTQRQLKKLQASGKATAAEVSQARRVIADRLTGVNVTASVRDLTSKTVQDSVMKFDAAFTAGRAERAGIERFEYSGGIQDNSREFCQQMTGERLTKDEIYRIWDGSDWAGKEAGDPFVVRGGYNCTHFWVPIEED